MKNREKWAQEIIDIALSGDTLAIKDGKPFGCTEIPCESCYLWPDCELEHDPSARTRVRVWAEAEAGE